MRTTLLLLLSAALLGLPGRPAAQTLALSPDEGAFQALAALYQTSTDRAAMIDAFGKFIKQYPKSPRAADARFMTGEAYMAKALDLLRQEKLSKMTSDARVLAGANPAVIAELTSAAEAFSSVIADYSKSGLEASAQYRLGEIYYNMGSWDRAAKEFEKVENKYPKSYAVPESLLGVVYANLAMNRFQTAQNILFHLEETYLPYARDPALLFAKAVVELNRKNYAQAQKLFAGLEGPQARFFLGKAYLYDGKSYMAASVFEKLLKEFPGSDYREEAEFLTADSFFLAKDYDGAIVKYQGFLRKYPSSKLRSAAVFRIGASQFSKKDYASARSNFQSIIDKSPRDFFAPLSQYFIAESYLENSQTRDALFAYTKVTVNHAGSSVAPASLYKLAWCQYQLNDFTQSVSTLGGFLTLYPTHALAKNAYYLMGNAQLALKKPAEALRSFQNAVDLAPSSEVAEQALFMILRTEYERGNYNNILTSYQFVFKHLPPVGSKWRAMSLLYVAEAYMALNLIDDARSVYSTIARIYPNDPSALYAQEGLVWCYAWQGDSEAAVKARDRLRSMLASAPEKPASEGVDAVAIADSYFNSREYEKAYQAYEAFATEKPASPQAPGALYRAGLALYRLRYYTQAVELWTRLSTNYPDAKETEQADFQRADTWFRAQKYAEAVAAYNAIIARYPKSKDLPLAWLRLAQVRFNLKDDPGAADQARTVLRNYPDSPEAMDAMDLLEAVLDRARGMDYKAILGELAGAEPKNRVTGEAQFRLGRRQFEAKDFAGAIASLKAFSVDYIDHPSIKDAQFYLGESYFQTGDMEAAGSVFERFTANYPEAKEHAVSLFRLGNSWYNLKKYEAAAKAYSKLSELYPESEYVKPALFNLALCYKNIGATDLAEEAYHKYFDLTGKSDEAIGALWEIFNLQKSKGDLSGAMKTLTEIYGESQGKEDALEALYYMGEMNYDNRQMDEARDYWERLAGQKPLSSPWRLQALVKLGEIYEAEKNNQEAARVYADIGRNATNPDVAKAAAARAQALSRQPSAPAVPAARQAPARPAQAQPAARPQKPAPPAEEPAMEEDRPARKAPAKRVQRRVKPASLPASLPGLEDTGAEAAEDEPAEDDGE